MGELFASLSSASTVQISCSLATAAAAASGVASVLADRFGQDCHNKLMGMRQILTEYNLESRPILVHRHTLLVYLLGWAKKVGSWSGEFFTACASAQEGLLPTPVIIISSCIVLATLP